MHACCEKQNSKMLFNTAPPGVHVLFNPLLLRVDRISEYDGIAFQWLGSQSIDSELIKMEINFPGYDLIKVGPLKTGEDIREPFFWWMTLKNKPPWSL